MTRTALVGACDPEPRDPGDQAETIGEAIHGSPAQAYFHQT